MPLPKSGIFPYPKRYTQKQARVTPDVFVRNSSAKDYSRDDDHLALVS